MLTEKNVFDKEKYRMIGKLIMHGQEKDKGIETKYLKYALVTTEKPYTKYEIDRYSEYFFNDKNKMALSILKKGLLESRITKKEYEYGKKKFEKTQFIVPPNKKFKTEVNLKKQLQNLKKLGIIESVNPKKGYPYWSFTDKGLIVYLRHNNLRLINLLEDYNNLIYVSHILADIVLLEKEKKLNERKNKKDKNGVRMGD